MPMIPQIKTVDFLLLKSYLRTFAFVFSLFLVIAFVMVLFDGLDDLLENEASLFLGILYLILRLPHEILKATPLIVVISMMISIGDMIRHNEILVLQIAGYSALRLLAPLAAFLVFVVFLSFLLYEKVAGPASLTAHSIMETQIKKGDSGLSGTRGIWMHGENDRIYHVQTYLPHTMEMRGFSMFVFQGPHKTISQRIDADTAVWQPQTGYWTMTNVVAHNIHADGSIARDIVKSDDYDLDRTPKDFERVTMDEELMSRSELKRMVDMLEKSGESSRFYLADLRIKEAFPFAVFFLGVLSFGVIMLMGSAGKTSGTGIGLLMVIGYYMSLSLGKSLAHAGFLSAGLGAWSPNLIAITAIGYVFYKLYSES